jgi:hypothetical protein
MSHSNNNFTWTSFNSLVEEGFLPEWVADDLWLAVQEPLAGPLICEGCMAVYGPPRFYLIGPTLVGIDRTCQSCRALLTAGVDVPFLAPYVFSE